LNVPVRINSNLAIVSLVSGILGWTFVPFLGSLIAVVTGHLARAEIRREPERLEGDGMAVGGLILGYSLLIICLVCLALLILFFGGIAVLLGWLGFNGHLN
jgi:small-conductance mechanosensitive channel